MFKNNAPCFLAAARSDLYQSSSAFFPPSPLILLILLPLPTFTSVAHVGLMPPLPNPFLTEVTPLSSSFLLPSLSPLPHLLFFHTCLPVSCLFQSNWLEPHFTWFVMREKFHAAACGSGGTEDLKQTRHPRMHLCVCATDETDTSTKKPAAVQNMGNSIRSEWTGQIFLPCQET